MGRLRHIVLPIPVYFRLWLIGFSSIFGHLCPRFLSSVQNTPLKWSGGNPYKTEPVFSGCGKLAPIALFGCGSRDSSHNNAALWSHALPSGRMAPLNAENVPPQEIGCHKGYRHRSIGNRNSSFAPQPVALAAKGDGNQCQDA